MELLTNLGIEWSPYSYNHKQNWFTTISPRRHVPRKQARILFLLWNFVAVTTGTWCIICEEFVSSRLVGPNIIGLSIFRHYICFLVKIGIISSVIIDCNTHRMQTKIGKKSSYTFSMFIFLFFFCFIKIFIIITNVQCKTNSSSLK